MGSRKKFHKVRENDWLSFLILGLRCPLLQARQVWWAVRCTDVPAGSWVPAWHSQEEGKQDCDSPGEAMAAWAKEDLGARLITGEQSARNVLLGSWQLLLLFFLVNIERNVALRGRVTSVLISWVLVDVWCWKPHTWAFFVAPWVCLVPVEFITAVKATEGACWRQCLALFQSLGKLLGSQGLRTAFLACEMYRMWDRFYMYVKGVFYHFLLWVYSLGRPGELT